MSCDENNNDAKWQCDSFFFQTKRGKVKHVVRERYLRDDLSCQSSLCTSEHCTSDDTQNQKVLSESGSYYIPTADVLLSQIDVIQHQAVCNIIILESVNEAVRNTNKSVYNRLSAILRRADRSFILFSNDHHRDTFVSGIGKDSEKISVAAEWYQSHLPNSKIVILENTEKCMEELVKPHLTLFPELGDLIASPVVTSTSTSSNNTRKKFTEHLTEAAMLAGLKSERFFQGVLRTKRTYCFAGSVLINNGSEKDGRVAVLIEGKEDLNRSTDGDVVVIELLPTCEWGKSKKKKEEDSEEASEEVMPEPTLNPNTGTSTSTRSSVQPRGRVVGILKRSWRPICASIDDSSKSSSSSSVLVIPVSPKFPKIRIKTRQLSLLKNQRLVIHLDSWPSTEGYPLGHYIKSLGEIGNKATETAVLLTEHQIPTEEFSQDVLRCLPPSDWKITPEIVAERTDLRHLPVMSIDPPNCKDIDDALHALTLPNGNIQVGVHIADVTYFVKANSALDEEAVNRGTSTYLVDQRLDMLPGFLTTQLCSLRSDEDHLAFSVLWELKMSKDEESFEVVNVEFMKSVIHSVASLSYQQAQVMLDESRTKSRSVTPCAQRIGTLHRIATILKKRRISAGALSLASPEVRFVLDDSASQNPTDVTSYALRETNALVEEFMLLANITVAKKILTRFPTLSVLRCHPAPAKSQFEELATAASAIGIKIGVETSKDLADSLEKATKAGDAYFNKMLRILATRCMLPASYFCSGSVASVNDFHHYGLAAPVYTHFTSPIRRYADVMVHRLLAASCGIEALPIAYEDKKRTSELTEHLNRRHLSAQLAGRDSVSLHTLLYFDANPVSTVAVVTSLTDSRIKVMLPKFGIEGLLQLNDDMSIVYDKESRSCTLINDQSGSSSSVKKLAFLDHVSVRVSVELRNQRQELKITLLDNLKRHQQHVSKKIKRS